MMKRIFIALALLWGAAHTALADDTFQTPVTGEILSGWQRADGSRMIGLRLQLAPGWKTYWRTPGDAGIPPQFDWSGSRNLHSVGIIWPAPSVFLTAGMQTIGYGGEVVLPIAVTPRKAGQPIKIKTVMDLGVCSDICVPFELRLEAAIDDGNTAPTPQIAAALASRPYSGQEAGVRSATCALRPTEDGLAIEAKIAMPSAGGKEVVIIEPGPPNVWMSETDARRSGAALTATGEMMRHDGGPIALDRSQIVITILGRNHAVEVRGCEAG